MADYNTLALNEFRSDLAAAERQREETRRQREQIERRQDQIKARCEHIRAAIALLEEKLNAGSDERPAETDEPREIGPDAFASMTMPQAILKCLRLARRPLAKSELMAILRSGGKEEGKHFSQAVYNTLHRLSRIGGPIRRGSNGGWTVADTDAEPAPSTPSLIGT